MDRDRTRTLRAVAVLIALIVGVVGTWALSSTSGGAGDDLPSGASGVQSNDTNTGSPFPFVEVQNLDGETVSLSATENRPMVVNFWFSTCEPCKREMPALAAAAADSEGTVDFIGINPNDSAETARRFLDSYGVGYPNYLDDGDQMAAAKVALMPSTFFLAADGTIVARESGEISPEKIAQHINRLVGITG